MGRVAVSLLLLLALVASVIAQSSLTITSNSLSSNYAVTSTLPPANNKIGEAQYNNKYYGGFTGALTFNGQNYFSTEYGIYYTTWDQPPSSTSINYVLDLSTAFGDSTGKRYQSPSYPGVFNYNPSANRAYFATGAAFVGWTPGTSPTNQQSQWQPAGMSTSSQYFTEIVSWSTSTCNSYSLLYTSVSGTTAYIMSYYEPLWGLTSFGNSGSLTTSSNCWTIIPNGNTYYIACTGIVLAASTTSNMPVWPYTCNYLSNTGYTSYSAGAGQLTTGVMNPGGYLYLGSSLGLAFEIDTGNGFSILRVTLMFSISQGGLSAFRSVLLDSSGRGTVFFWGSADGQVARVNLRTFTVFATAYGGKQEDMVNLYTGISNAPGYFYIAGPSVTTGFGGTTNPFHTYRVQMASCGLYTCGTCYASPTDVEYCGWCTDTQSCTNSTSCAAGWSAGTNTGGICPALVSTSPASGSIAGGTTVVITGTNFSQSASYKCQFGSLTAVTATYVSQTSVSCSAPSVSSAQALPVVIQSQTVAGSWITYASGVNYTYYDCRSISGCTSCVQSISSFPECGWCFGSGACTAPFVSGSSATGRCSSNTFMTSCPSVGNISPFNMSVVTVSSGTAVTVATSNFPSSLSPSSLACSFVDPSGSAVGSAVTTTTVASTSLTCNVPVAVNNAVNSHNGIQNFGVVVQASGSGSAVAPQSTGTFEVFNCSLLTACFDCNTRSACMWCYDSSTGNTQCQSAGGTCPFGTPSNQCASVNTIAPSRVTVVAAPTTTVQLNGFNLNSPSAGLTKCYWNMGSQQISLNYTSITSTYALCAVPSTVASQVGTWSVSLGNNNARQTQASSFVIYDCTSFSSCSTCLDVTMNNDCDWCLIPDNGPGCQDSTHPVACTGTSGPAWLTARGICPTLTSLEPSSLPLIGGPIYIKGDLFLGSANYTEVSCNWTSSSAPSSTIANYNTTTGEVQCDAPGGAAGVATVFLSDPHSAKAYTNSLNFSYVTCSQFTDCNSCLGTTDFCYWCGATCTDTCTSSQSARDGECPVVTSVSPDYSVTGGGELITITGSYFLTGAKRDAIEEDKQDAATAIATALVGAQTSSKIVKLSKRAGPYSCDFGGGFTSTATVDASGTHIYCATPNRPPVAVGGTTHTPLNVLYNGNLYVSTPGINLFSCNSLGSSVTSCIEGCFFNSSAYCGWCVASSSCGALSQCVTAENGTTTPVWQNPSCPSPTISPGLVPIKGGVPVVVSISDLSDSVQIGQLACNYGGVVTNVTALSLANSTEVALYNASDLSNITCTPPAVTSPQTVSFTVTYAGSNLFAPSSIEYVECSIYSSQCTRCLTISYCGWCGSSCTMQVECQGHWQRQCPLNVLAIGLGAGLGGAAFIALLLLVAFLIRRARRKAGLVIALREPNYVEIAWGTDTALAWKVPSDNYITLNNHLNRRDFILQLAIAFNCPPTEQESMAKSLVYVAHAYGFAAEMIQTCIRYEVTDCKHENTLFRNNSVASKMYKFFSRIVGIKYLFNCIARVILELEVLGREQQAKSGKPDSGNKEVSLLTMSMELDQTKQMDDDIDTDTNLLQLQLICQKLLNVLIKTSVKNIPPPFRKIFIEIDNSVMAKFQSDDAVYKGIGGLFFLRFVGPAITAPHVYGLLENPPNAVTQRQLVLISKVIQNIANMQEPGKKEEYMVALNQFIVQSIPKIVKFYDNLRLAVNLAEESPDDTQVMVVPEEVRLNGLAAIWNFLFTAKNKIRDWSDKDDCILDPMQRDDLRTMLNECEEAYPSAPKKIKTGESADGAGGGDKKKKKKKKDA